MNALLVARPVAMAVAAAACRTRARRRSEAPQVTPAAAENAFLLERLAMHCNVSNVSCCMETCRVQLSC